MMRLKRFWKSNTTQVIEYCQKHRGRLMQGWTCPHSQKVRDDETFCELTDPAGNKQIVNGCTGTVARIGSRFFKACILHDMCYHNEPAVSGMGKADCDFKFLSDMKKLCERSDSKIDCDVQIETLYNAVVVGGDSSWNCSKAKVAYPTSLDQL
jgi:hypothetical protein